MDFAFSAIILLALISVYEAITSNVRFPTASAEVAVSGLAIGLITIFILSNPVNVSKGIFVDARWVLLSCAAIFLNWRVVLIGAAIGAAYRYYQGGAGGVPGVYTDIVAVLVGFAWRFALSQFRISFKWYLHYVFALSLELSILLLLYFVLPDGKGPVVVGIITAPLLVLFPVVSTVLSLLLQHHWHKQVLAFSWTDSAKQSPTARHVRIRETSMRSLALSLLIVASLITLTLMQHNNSTQLSRAEQSRCR